MLVGLFFFIRASVKDRTEQIKLVVSDSESPTEILTKLQKYFEERAYKPIAVDADTQQATFQGFVQASLFLAILLTILATVGLSCLALILSLLFPASSSLCWLLLVLAPVAGVFYWRKAGRLEKISLSVPLETKTQNLVVVTGHRDELINLQKNLSLTVVD
ncbi:MAG: cofactor assembly of complex C subunit B [Pleurocapsa sp.]